MTESSTYPLRDIQRALLIGRDAGFELGERAGRLYMEREVEHVDRERLHTAIRTLTARHDMLRTIILRDGRQRVMPEAPPHELEIRDLRGLDDTRRALALQATRDELQARTPEPDAWPLVDIVVSHVSDHVSILHMTFDLLVVDASSTVTYQQELAALYLHPERPLPPLDYSFRRYIAEEDRFVDPAELAQSHAYWTRYVAELPPRPELPVRAIVDEPPRTDAFVDYLDALTWRRLRDRGMERHLTHSSILLALFGEVIGTYSANRHFIVNLAMSNRLPIHPHVGNLLGVFTSPTLFAVDTSRRESFAQRARRLQKELAAHWRQGRLAGMFGLRELIRQQSAMGQAVAPIVFTPVLAGGSGPPVLGSLRYWWMQTPQVRLENQIVEEPDGRLLTSWNAATETFPPGLVREMLAGFLDAAKRLVRDPHAWDATPLSIVPAAHVEIAAAANATTTTLPVRHLHAGFLARAVDSTERVAVVAPDRTLTYGELDARSRAIAARLRGLVKPDDLVGVVMTKGWEQIVAVLGILRAGAAYLPIDAELPAARIRQLLDDANAVAAITQRATAHDWLRETIVVEPDARDTPGGAADDTPQGLDDIAYVIFTSGSTGRPKGVVIEHRAAVNTVEDITARFAVGANDRVLATSSLSFDLSVYDVFGLLAVGGALVLPDPSRIADPAYLAALVEREGVTIWNSVPATLRLVAEWAAGQADPVHALAGLRLVMLSGDWIPINLPAAIRTLAPASTIVSLGGATEASIWSIVHVVDRIDPTWKSIPYGRALANQQMFVLDETCGPRPLGVVGEIYIGGVGLARGYHGDPAKTAAHFVRDPATGARLYRTGDLGRYFPDGTIELLGRKDSQVKIQGYRVELGEIEAVLLEHPAVAAAALRVLDSPSGKLLAGYAISKSANPPAIEELQQHLATKLPRYMCPQFLQWIDAFPLSPNGKLDRQRLPDPRTALVAPGPPRTATERALQQIWERALGVAVGVTDRFFDRGGTSIAAVVVMVEVERAFGKQLSLGAFLQEPTIEALARALDSNAPHASASLLQLRPGDGPPLVLVHPTGGNVLCYEPLARALDPRIPIIGFQARGPATTIEELASAYVDELLEAQPRGPYHLGGWSLGGIIAFEMARQLAAKGAAIGRLILVDSVAPDLARPHIGETDAALLRDFVRDLGLSPNAVDDLDLAVESPVAFLSRLLAASGLPSTDSPARIEQLWQVFRANEIALARYHPAPLDQPVLLIRAEHGFGELLGVDHMGWRSLVARLVIETVPSADHYTVVSAHASTLAQIVERAITTKESGAAYV